MGRKFRSTQASVTTDYIDGIEWVDNTLNLLHMEEGRITKSGTTYTYEYLLKDHLGNNCSGFKPPSSGAAPTTASFRSDYDPFCLQYQQNIVVGPPEINIFIMARESRRVPVCWINSLISGRNNHMIQDIMKSPQFAKATQGSMENGTDNKFFFAGEFGPSGAVKSGNNMTAQMIGKS